MKKTYIIPETLIADLSMCSNILTGSPDPTKDLSDRYAPKGAAAEVKDSKTIWDEEW